MKGSSRGDISIGFRSKTLGRVVSAFSLTNNPIMSNTHFLRHVTTSLLSHCRVQLTTCLNYCNPSKQSLCLLPLLCSTQSCQRGPFKTFLSDFPLLLKSLQKSKNTIH